MERNKRNERGITLIALVVTIVVLLILASISINTLQGDNNIIRQAKKSKIETEKSEIKEQIDIMTVKSIDEVGNINKDILKEKLENLPNGKEIIESGDIIYVIYPDYTFKIDVFSGNTEFAELEKTIDETPWELAGEGTEDNPYLIQSIEDLVAFSNSVNEYTKYDGKYIKLERTLDFKSPFSYNNHKTKVSETTNRIITEDENGTEIMSFLTSGKGFNPIGGRSYFYGHFDGNGKEIRNLYINRADEKYVALFGLVWDGTITKLGITGSITGYQYVGSFIGEARIDTRLTYCFNKATIIGQGATGGLIGKKNEESELGIVSCYNLGSVTGTNKSFGYNHDAAGGLISINGSDNVIKYSYNGGNVSNVYYVGGISGDNMGIIQNCFNSGNINCEGAEYTGGIAGTMITTPDSIKIACIKNCYNTGMIKNLNNGYKGGILGYTQSNSRETSSPDQYTKGEVYNSYYLTGTCTVGMNGQDITGQAEVMQKDNMPQIIEVVQNQIEIDGEMLDVWKEDTENINNGYPILYWQ